MDLKDLLKLAIQRRASDLHLTENSPPVLRIDGRLVLTDDQILTKEELKKAIYGILSDLQKETVLLAKDIGASSLVLHLVDPGRLPELAEIIETASGRKIW